MFYMFMITAAPPKRAAAPTAPVFIGMAIPLDLLDPAEAPLPPLPPLAPPALVEALAADGVAIAEDGTGTPLVKGTLVAELAPAKATL